MGHIDNFKKFRNKEAKALEEQALADGAVAAVDPIAEQPLTDAIANFNKQIASLTDQRNAKQEELNKLRLEAAKTKAAAPPVPANAAPAQPAQTPPVV